MYVINFSHNTCTARNRQVTVDAKNLDEAMADADRLYKEMACDGMMRILLFHELKASKTDAETNWHVWM
jgi:hypothetical protein